MCMSSLRSALDEMRNQELAALSDAALEEDFEELQAAAEALESERLRRLAEIRRTLRERMRASPLMNEHGLTRRLENAYREMWTNWCSR